MATLTQAKKDRRPEYYLIKADRTRVYRALYGDAMQHDPQGLPELNPNRRLPQGFKWQDAESVFQALACQTVPTPQGEQTVSNGLFPQKRWEELQQRIEVLKKLRRAE